MASAYAREEAEYGIFLFNVYLSIQLQAVR